MSRIEDKALAIVSEAREKGERANLRYADLAGANLHRADLYCADMTGADLRGADLRDANLRYADLTGADLTYANLRGADLTGTDLRDANLRYADLTGACGNFCTGYFGKHHAVAAGGYISIGCEYHTYQEWLNNGAKIGEQNKYSPDEITDYMDWIRLAIRVLTRDEVTK